MKTAFEILSQLRSLGAEISVTDGRIRLSAAKGVLTPELRDELARHKSEIVALLGGGNAAKERRDSPALTMRSRDEALPLSFAQQRMWLLQRLFPDNSSYNIPLPLRLRGPIDIAALEESLSALVARHEVLRTTFKDEAGKPVQVIEPPARVPLTVTEVDDDAAGGGRLGHAQRIVEAKALRPFDLARELPIRASLLRVGDEDHVLLVVLHHIAADGWSLAVFNRELAVLYRARCSGSNGSLPELPIQYADFAQWQREQLSGAVLDRHLDYWRRTLRGVARLDLPADRPRPPRQTFNGATHRKMLPPSTAAALERLSQRTGASLFMTLLAAFNVLLHRYSGQDDIVVGSPVANRSRTELESLVGFFVNTLVLRTDVSGDPPFTELIARVRKMALSAFEHQDLPFERLVEELEPVRDPSRNPLFQVLFALQNAPEIGVELAGVDVTSLDYRQLTSDFDLDVHVGHAGDALQIDFVYNTDLFDGATIERMAEHFHVLLDGIVTDPETRISALPLMTEDERRQVNVHWNDTAGAYPLEPVHVQFEAQVDRTPNDAAVVFATESDAETISYREIDVRANRIAHHLRSRGVRPGSLVGLCVERSPQMVVGLLGILKSGAVYVPLDPSNPSDRLRYMATQGGVRAVITETANEGLVPAGVDIVALDRSVDEIASRPGDRLDSGVDVDARMYVIYTSGSTGRPKGVEIGHRSVSNFLSSMARLPGLGAGERFMGVARLSFDISVAEIFLPLVVGGAAVVVPREVTADAQKLMTVVERVRPHVFQATPATWQMLVQAGWEGDQNLKILCGGEELPRPLAQSVLTRGRALWNMYGPTETTVWSAVARVESGEGPVPIGTPIANTQLYVLDAHLNPVPPGVPGELYIGGAGLALCYHDRPELTAERFVCNPIADGVHSSRMYRTGDLARWLPSGKIEYLGRLDHQVKLRGFRIELGEIESVLANHPVVQHAVAIISNEVLENPRLIAFVIPEDGQVVQVAELREFLRDRLPSYMVPSAFVPLDELPLSPAGKVDRRQLRSMPLPAADAPAEDARPSSPVEEAIAGAFAEVLSLESVGLHDDFFDLGGHSLLATQLIARIHTLFQVDLPLSDVFDAPTVAELATLVEQEQSVGHIAPPPIRPVKLGAERPLSWAQARLWSLDRDGTRSAYCTQLRLGLAGRLDEEVLGKTLAAMTLRHEVLRTRFESDGGADPRPVVAEAIEVRPVVVDHTGVSAGERERAVAELAAADARTPFDLTSGPLLRANLVRSGPHEHDLVLTLHRIVADDFSIGILAREFATHYSALCNAETPRLPALAVQYGDFAAWQRDLVAGGLLDAQCTYWRQQLAEAPALGLSAGRARSAAKAGECASHRFFVGKSDTTALHSMSRQQDVPVSEVLLAAFQTVLASHTGQHDIAVGSPVPGRTHGEIEDLVGPFENFFVLRGDLSGNPTFSELLRRTHRISAAVYEHQEVPFEMLVDATLARTPLFEVVFAMRHELATDLEAPGLTIKASRPELVATPFALELSFAERPSGLVGSLTYDAARLDVETVERLAGQLQQVILDVAVNPHTPLSDLAATAVRRETGEL